MSESVKVRMAKVPDELTSREIRALFESVRADLVALVASHNRLITDFNAHNHGGITAGAATSDPPTATTAGAVTLNTIS